MRFRAANIHSITIPACVSGRNLKGSSGGSKTRVSVSSSRYLSKLKLVVLVVGEPRKRAKMTTLVKTPHTNPQIRAAATKASLVPSNSSSEASSSDTDSTSETSTSSDESESDSTSSSSGPPPVQSISRSADHAARMTWTAKSQTPVLPR